MALRSHRPPARPPANMLLSSKKCSPKLSDVSSWSCTVAAHHDARRAPHDADCGASRDDKGSLSAMPL